ncbi:MAG TPA: hypothetical protein ENI92_04820, partial [Bacteroidetes bacterium]|nr:hypothetical protein [Bacteroidota bacterium]
MSTPQEALFAGLLRIGREISSGDPEKRLGVILDCALESLGAERGFLVLMGEDGVPELRAARHLDP